MLGVYREASSELLDTRGCVYCAHSEPHASRTSADVLPIGAAQSVAISRCASASGTLPSHNTVGEAVATPQIAPTILKLLGLDPEALQAVDEEGTEVLPELR
jgi:hypothetical protein